MALKGYSNKDFISEFKATNVKILGKRIAVGKTESHGKEGSLRADRMVQYNETVVPSVLLSSIFLPVFST